jgi:hypothetical protein
MAEPVSARLIPPKDPEGITEEEYRNQYSYIFEPGVLFKPSGGWWTNKDIRLVSSVSSTSPPPPHLPTHTQRFLKHVFKLRRANFTSTLSVHTCNTMIDAWFKGQNFTTDPVFAEARPKGKTPRSSDVNAAMLSPHSVSTEHAKDELYAMYVVAHEKVYPDNDSKPAHEKATGEDRFVTSKAGGTAQWFADVIERLNSKADRDTFNSMSYDAVLSALTDNGTDDEKQEYKEMSMGELMDAFIVLSCDDAQAGL